MLAVTDFVQSRCSSIDLMERARLSLAGGENSTMRVLPYHLPLVVDRGEGCRVWDVEGTEYLDFNMAYGPLLFGHRYPAVVDAVVRQVTESGSQLGFPAEVSIRVAEKVKQLFPSLELLRFSSTGSEAVAAAVRLARAFTGRKTIIAFEGHYHGSSDAVFHRYHAAVDELPRGPYGRALPGTIGLADAPNHLLTTRWNDIDSLARCLEDHRGSVAAVIMEPIMGNASVIAPDANYLATVQAMVRDAGALLIFDEVITGLRVAPGGAQQFYDVQPDITVLSKALGGGFPISCFGASREIMALIAEQKLFHGGVYSGNGLVMAAAEAMLDEIIEGQDRIYASLFDTAEQLVTGFRDIMQRLGIPHVVQSVGPLMSLLLTRGDVDQLRNYRDVREHVDFERYIRFQHALQRTGVYFHPNAFEPWFLSTAHSMRDIDDALERMEWGAKSCLLS
ncbi:MAG: aspartate aminotransferase family protein [Planctomycetaceae bacterium]|nr:aspartate aminotransferase family protein [Planctomycetaceae bacterium]